jgi:FkbM family methyltransferase
MIGVVSAVGRADRSCGETSEDIKGRFGHFGLARTLLRPRRWRHLVRVSRVVREQPSFLWREANRRVVTGRYHLRDGEHVVYVRHSTPDLGGLFEVFVLGNYEPPAPIHELLERIAGSRTLRVADLGANIGLFGLRVFRDFPSAEVVSYEPDPANARVLELTAHASVQRDRWRLVTACAGACSDNVPFLAGAYLESQIVTEDDGRGRLLPKVDAFADLLSVDWIKIDIEGGEWELLTDPRFAQLTAAVLCLEYHPNRCPAESPRALAVSALTAAGYRIEPFEERAPNLGELWAWRPDPK